MVVWFDFWPKSGQNLRLARNIRYFRHNQIFDITMKSNKIDHFSEFLEIAGDFWQFRTELKISIEFHSYQEIPQNWSLSGASQNSWRFLAISSKTETIDRIPSLPGNPIKPITFWSFSKFLSISGHFKQNWKLLIVMVRASSPARQWQYDITRTAVTGQCVLSHNYYIP